MISFLTLLLSFNAYAEPTVTTDPSLNKSTPWRAGKKMGNVDMVEIDEQSLSYTITTPAGSVIGYSTNVNYTNTLGGDETTETTELPV